jgi:hypothetical protein
MVTNNKRYYVRCVRTFDMTDRTSEKLYGPFNYERNANKVAENLEKDSNTLVAFVEVYENEEKPFNG